jgi:hypothetical protein
MSLEAVIKYLQHRIEQAKGQHPFHHARSTAFALSPSPLSTPTIASPRSIFSPAIHCPIPLGHLTPAKPFICKSLLPFSPKPKPKPNSPRTGTPRHAQHLIPMSGIRSVQHKRGKLSSQMRRSLPHLEVRFVGNGEEPESNEQGQRSSFAATEEATG